MEQMERTTLTTPDLFDPELDKLVSSVGQQLVFPPKHIFSMPGEELADTPGEGVRSHCRWL